MTGYDWQDLAAIYGQRWDIELRLRDVKSTLELENLRMKTPLNARKTLRPCGFHPSASIACNAAFI